MDKKFDDILDNLKEKASSISMDEESISKLLKDVKEKLEDNEILSSLTSDIKLTIEMVTAWKNGKYKNLSQNTVILVIAGLLYIANPLNILPKVLKKTFLDDLLIIFYILKKVKKELRLYEYLTEEFGFTPEIEVDESNYFELYKIL